MQQRWNKGTGRQGGQFREGTRAEDTPLDSSDLILASQGAAAEPRVSAPEEYDEHEGNTEWKRAAGLFGGMATCMGIGAAGGWVAGTVGGFMVSNPALGSVGEWGTTGGALGSAVALVASSLFFANKYYNQD